MRRVGGCIYVLLFTITYTSCRIVAVPKEWRLSEERNLGHQVKFDGLNRDLVPTPFSVKKRACHGVNQLQQHVCELFQDQ